VLRGFTTAVVTFFGCGSLISSILWSGRLRFRRLASVAGFALYSRITDSLLLGLIGGCARGVGISPARLLRLLRGFVSFLATCTALAVERAVETFAASFAGMLFLLKRETYRFAHPVPFLMLSGA
jgi:hypothetical protein